MASPQPVGVTINGKQYQIFIGSDGQRYINDPNHELSALVQSAGLKYQALPGWETVPQAQIQKTVAVHGLGAGGNKAASTLQTAAPAVSMIPYVGPFLAAGMQIASMFVGGGDPTPAHDIWKAIIDAREAVANLKNQLAGSIVDTFTVPAGLDRKSDGPDGGNTANVVASKITCDVLGIQFTSIHKVKRNQWYAALQQLQQQQQQLAQQVHDKELTAQIVASIQGPVAQPTTTPVATPTPPPPPTTTPAVISPQPQIVPVSMPDYSYAIPQMQQPVQAGMFGNMQGVLPYMVLGGILLLAVTQSKGSDNGVSRRRSR